MKKDKEIIEYIKSSHKEIIESLKQESIDVYLFLKSEFKKEEPITKNFVFQFLYRSFYRMDNAGLTDEFNNKYFELLEKHRKKSRSFELKKNIIEFSKIKTKKNKESLQFSFFTKLYHTIDNSQPIYDSKVCKACGIGQKYYIRNQEERINKLLNDYNDIKKLYARIEEKHSLAETITFFNNHFKNPDISKIMLYDFIFWQAGKLLEDKEKKEKEKN